MGFSSKQVKRSIRDFNGAAQDLLNTGYATYQSRVNRFVQLMIEDEVINSIVAPLLSMPINYEEIENEDDDRYELNLPTDMNKQLAYVLQILNKSYLDEINLDDYALSVYWDTSLDSNIANFINDIVSPCLRELFNRLSDLIEDEVDGKDEVSPAVLKIINYGSITASKGSQVAFGHTVTQQTTYTNNSEEILQRVKEGQVVPEEKLGEVKELTAELEKELETDTPSQGKLKTIAAKMHEVGQKGLLKITSDVCNDPRWGQAVADFLFDLI